MNAGESVRLQVRTSPGYPVTFLSLDLGTFQNSLNAITVEAKEKVLLKRSIQQLPGPLTEMVQVKSLI